MLAGAQDQLLLPGYRLVRLDPKAVPLEGRWPVGPSEARRLRRQVRRPCGVGHRGVGHGAEE